MARKAPALPAKFKFKGFENVEFTPEEREGVINWIEKTSFDPVDCAVVLVESGYKLGLGYDDYHSCNAITATCKDKTSPYYGYCFTFRHADMGRGLQVMRYLLDTFLATELYDLEHRQRMHDW